MKRTYSLIIIVTLFTFSWTQVSTGETPYGISHGLNRSAIPIETMPAVNVDSLPVEDCGEPDIPIPGLRQ